MLSQNLSSSVDKTIQTENLNDSSQETLWTEISIQNGQPTLNCFNKGNTNTNLNPINL